MMRRLLAVMAALILLAAACGDDADDGSAGAGAEPDANGEMDGGDGAEDGAGDGTEDSGDSGDGDAGDGDSGLYGGADGDATVTLAQTEEGEVLADASGRTLYIFTQDEPGVSNCTGDCLDLWPRYTPDEVVAGEGVDAGVLDTLEVDGTEQVTVDGLPLYYYAPDEEPGDVNGQGVGDVWFVVRGDGTIVR